MDRPAEWNVEAVSDVMAGLSEHDMAELAAFADGSLPVERRAAVEARLADSAELRAFVERQRRSLAATRALAAEPVPATLTASVAAAAPRRKRRGDRERGRGLAWRLGLAGAVVAAIAAVVVFNVNRAPAGPSVATAAGIARQAPIAAAPGPIGSSGTTLAASVQGVAFPDFGPAYGWHAVGVRQARVGGRPATAVYYGKDGRRIAYVIVSGSGLARPPSAASTTIGGVQYQTLRLNGMPAVTWRRSGHTCVLTGAATPAELLTLASWSSAAVS